MDKLGAMNAFAKVVALGSFAEAARTLGMTRSATSKAVMELERVLGARLLDRTTRRVRPTEAGLAYYERCLDILSRVEETEMQVARLHGEPAGVLRLNGPASFGALYLASAVAKVMGLRPNLRIELTLTDRFIDPIEEGADVTIRIAELADSSLIARKLAPARRVFVAFSRLCRRARRAARARGSRPSRLPVLWPHDHAPALADRARRRSGQRRDQFRPLLEQRRRPPRGGAVRAGRRLPANIPGRARHRIRRPPDCPRPLSAAYARRACALCVEPIPRSQDARVHRLPRQAVRRRTEMGPVFARLSV